MSVTTEFVQDLEAIKGRVPRPPRAVVTAGMPYANGPLHIGHLAGAHVPADIYARWLRMLIGHENVIFVCGTDDHGSAAELAAREAGIPIREFIDTIHAEQRSTLQRYGIALDIYCGTSRPECFSIHEQVAHDFLRRLHANGMLEKRSTLQWYDPVLERFLQDRFVRGRCPNPKCSNETAYSDECDVCGRQHDPTELIHPRSALSDAVPMLKETVHWWLDMWQVSEVLRTWVQSKEGTWRTSVFQEVMNTVLPSLRFNNTHEPTYKAGSASLPPHKRKYASGRQIQLQFETKDALNTGRRVLEQMGIPSEFSDRWAHRSITRDVAWGLPVPADIDPELADKTLHVWPDSLIAPISFTQVALAAKHRNPEEYARFWRDPQTRIFQFLGQDNVFFYVLMQGALWLGTQHDPQRLPEHGDYQLTDVFSSFHLRVNGEKMSKSRGNFVTGDQLLDAHTYSADQIRYFLALLSLSEKPSNFEFAALDERNRFLAGPINSAFERPISACHSKFRGRVPDGTLLEKPAVATVRMVDAYVRMMQRAEYSKLLNEIENYARVVNSLFAQYKPHDDRYPEQRRRDALYSAFYVLKTLVIMLYPFVPDTMNRLRAALRLDHDVFSVEQLGVPLAAGHAIGPKQQFFPAAADASVRATLNSHG
jgi:methionyl-tRNA synthetase